MKSVNYISICLIIGFSILFAHSVVARSSALDSLRNEITIATTDTQRILATSIYAWQIKYDSTEQFGKVAENILAQSKDLDFSKGIGLGESYVGVYHYINSNYSSASKHFENALNTYKTLGDSIGIAKCYNYLGLAHDGKGDYTDAIKAYMRSLQIKESLDDKLGIANTLNNIGVIYNYQKEYDKALNFFERCQLIYEEIGDKAGMAQALNNIGLVYDNKLETDKAIDYYLKSLKLEEELQVNPYNIALSNNNLGSLYSGKAQYDIAIYYYEKALEIYQQEQSKGGIALVNCNLAEALHHVDKIDKARELALYALGIAQEIESKDDVKQAYHILSVIEKKANNYDLAFQYQQQYFAVKDSIYSLEKAKEIAVIQSQYELQNQEEKKKRIEEQIARKESQKQFWTVHAIIAALLFVFILLHVLKVVSFSNQLYSLLVLALFALVAYLMSSFLTSFFFKENDLSLAPKVVLNLFVILITGFIFQRLLAKGNRK